MGPRQDRRLLFPSSRGHRRAPDLGGIRISNPSPARPSPISTSCSVTRSLAPSSGPVKKAARSALILPVGPMGMYRWAVYFLKEWDVSCDHVYGFNMDEWSDRQGTTLPSTDPGAFQNAMQTAFYGPLGAKTVPEAQRWFATPDRLPHYAARIAELKAEGAELIVIFGIGRVCHIAFWEPHFAAEYANVDEWKAQTHRIGALLHPLTIEQNALTSFKSRTTLVPAFANTIGPGLFLQADRIIGGADGIFDRGMQWQGLSLWMTLRYGPDSLDPQLLHADASGPALLPRPTRRSVGACNELSGATSPPPDLCRRVLIAPPPAARTGEGPFRVVAAGSFCALGRSACLDFDRRLVPGFTRPSDRATRRSIGRRLLDLPRFSFSLGPAMRACFRRLRALGKSTLGSSDFRKRLRLVPTFGELEERALLSLTIKIDYTYDSSNFFDTPAKRNVMEAAANSIASVLNDNLLAIQASGSEHLDRRFPQPEQWPAHVDRQPGRSGEYDRDFRRREVVAGGVGGRRRK